MAIIKTIIASILLSVSSCQETVRGVHYYTVDGVEMVDSSRRNDTMELILT